MSSKIEILIPCFDEEECLPILFNKLQQVCTNIKGIKWRVILVNDGSTDNTLKISENQLELNSDWCEGIIINFSRKFVNCSNYTFIIN